MPSSLKERKKEITQNTQGDNLVSLAEQAVEGEIYSMQDLEGSKPTFLPK